MSSLEDFHLAVDAFLASDVTPAAGAFTGRLYHLVGQVKATLVAAAVDQAQGREERIVEITDALREFLGCLRREPLPVPLFSDQLLAEDPLT